MTSWLRCCIVLGVVACTVDAAAAAQDRQITGFPDLPADAGRVAERNVGCLYFSGEITGSDAQRDADIARSMRKLRCATVAEDMAKIRHKYRKTPRVLDILEEAHD